MDTQRKKVRLVSTLLFLVIFGNLLGLVSFGFIRAGLAMGKIKNLADVLDDPLSYIIVLTSFNLMLLIAAMVALRRVRVAE